MGWKCKPPPVDAPGGFHLVPMTPSVLSVLSVFIIFVVVYESLTWIRGVTAAVTQLCVSCTRAGALKNLQTLVLQDRQTACGNY